MWTPYLNNQLEKPKLKMRCIGGFLVILGLLFCLNSLDIKSKGIAFTRIILAVVAVGLNVKIISDCTNWLENDLEEAYRQKRNARKFIRKEAIALETDAVIEGFYNDSLVETRENTIEIIPFNWQDLRNARQYPHISIEEKTGGGKSTLSEYLGSLLGGRFIAIAPHYKPGDFPSASLIVGRGRNYGTEASVSEGNLLELHQIFESVLIGERQANVLEFLELIHAEMRYRYTLDDYENTEKLNIVLDEFNSYGSKKGVKDLFKELIREARKVNIRLIILCQGSEVKALGIEGEGSLRENLTRIRLKTFAIKEAKINFNKCKEGSENQKYWQSVLDNLNNNNWAALIDDQFGVIPDLSNWNNINTNQVILGLASPSSTPSTDSYNIEVEILPQSIKQDQPTCLNCGSTELISNGGGRMKCKNCGRTSKKKSIINSI